MNFETIPARGMAPEYQLAQVLYLHCDLPMHNQPAGLPATVIHRNVRIN